MDPLILEVTSIATPADIGSYKFKARTSENPKKIPILDVNNKATGNDRETWGDKIHYAIEGDSLNCFSINKKGVLFFESESKLFKSNPQTITLTLSASSEKRNQPANLTTTVILLGTQEKNQECQVIFKSSHQRQEITADHCDNFIVVSHPRVRAHGRSGNDTLKGQHHHDHLRGGRGDDSLRGKAGNDTLIGSSGTDLLIGHKHHDLLRGGRNDDVLRGKSGNDTLRGGEGRDFLQGAKGSDLLLGHQGHDLLRGNSGDDTLSGGPGNDSLSGGSGSDLFVLSPGQDDVRDFNLGEGDRISMPTTATLKLHQMESHLLLTDSINGISTTLLNTSRADLLNAQPELLN